MAVARRGHGALGVPGGALIFPLVTWNAPASLFRAELPCPLGLPEGNPRGPGIWASHRGGVQGLCILRCQTATHPTAPGAGGCASHSGGSEGTMETGKAGKHPGMRDFLKESHLLFLARAERGGWDEGGPVPGLGVGEVINEQKLGVRRSKVMPWVARALPWAAQTAPGTLGWGHDGAGGSS